MTTHHPDITRGTDPRHGLAFAIFARNGRLDFAVPCFDSSGKPLSSYQVVLGGLLPLPERFPGLDAAIAFMSAGRC